MGFSPFELCGDMAKVEIPSRLAYGKKGLGTVIPPNTDNWLFIKIQVGSLILMKEALYWELRSEKIEQQTYAK